MKKNKSLLEKASPMLASVTSYSTTQSIKRLASILFAQCKLKLFHGQPDISRAVVKPEICGLGP